MRIVILAAIVAAIFATIGSKDFYHMLDFFSDMIQAVADNYLKK